MNIKQYAIIPGIIQRSVWPFTRLLFPFFIHFKIEGFEHVAKLKTNFIIVSNHSSELDPILIATCMPFFSRTLPLFFVGRDKAFYKELGWKGRLYGGTFFKMLGVFPAYAGLDDYPQALAHHVKLIKDGRSVCIFPSGKRNLRGERPVAKPGVGFLAHETKLPVIPVLIRGAEDTNVRAFFSRKKTVRLTFGAPIYSQDILQESYQAAATEIMERIERLA